MILPGIVGRVRGLLAGNYPENREDEQFHMTPLGDGQIAQALPPLAEIVRLGNSWQSISQVYTALTALPTTVGIFGVWNGEPDNGKSYIIDSLAVVKILADTIQVDELGYFVTTVRAPVAPITDGGAAIVSLSGRRSYDGKARTAAGVTTVAGRWDHIGTSPDMAAALAGTGWQTMDVPLFGRYIVPPGAMFAAHRAEVTATAGKFRLVIRWHEVQLPVVS